MEMHWPNMLKVVELMSEAHRWEYPLSPKGALQMSGKEPSQKVAVGRPVPHIVLLESNYTIQFFIPKDLFILAKF